MFYQEKQDALPNKEGIKLWRPEIVRTGKVVNTRKLSKLISTATTLTEADIHAVLLSLPEFMNVYLREGHTVRLAGLGTFTVYGRTSGKGVASKDEVRPSQFSSLVLKFRPEYTMPVGGNRTRTLLNDVEFININSMTKANITDAGNDGDGGDDGGEEPGWVDPSV